MTKQEQTALVNLDGEVWKPVVGFEMSYCVSNYARVKMPDKLVGRFARGTHFIKEHLVSVFINGDGRPFVYLTKGRKTNRVFLEDAVADAFIPNPNSYRRIIHKNGDIADCRVSNLERAEFAIPAEPGEEWRVIPKWERYAVSSIGRVASLGEPYLCRGQVCRRAPQIIKPRSNGAEPGYLHVVLSDGKGHRKAFAVHRLVAMAFIPNPDNLPFINHKDEDKTNNSVFINPDGSVNEEKSNLEWCTQQYNCNYGTHNERMAKTLRETAYQRKQVVQLSQEGRLIAIYESIQEGADTLGISRMSISLCCQGKNKTGHGFKWMYLSDYLKK